MTDYVIPCETFVRLARVLTNMPDDIDPCFNVIRIDNGVAVATDRRILAAENIGGPAGIVHVIADAQLIAHCAAEAPFASSLTITVVPELRFATAKTTLGYMYPGNCVYWDNVSPDYDRWRSVVGQCSKPATAARGGMLWVGDRVAQLIASSPSGSVIFEEIIDATGRPTIIRDVNDYNWLGVFQPFERERHHTPATLPNWMLLK